uniref:Uncharacterized protein n=1 Tax=Rousettus aegyptiacus TaxID=9407 RepID=A0A7J8EZR7_ROUAE|nr:hypothetical protein HJG63_012218 [Rousettus aegyptiacus]
MLLHKSLHKSLQSQKERRLLRRGRLGSGEAVCRAALAFSGWLMQLQMIRTEAPGPPPDKTKLTWRGLESPGIKSEGSRLQRHCWRDGVQPVTVAPSFRAATTEHHRLVGGLQAIGMYCSQVWRLEVQDQGAGGFGVW